MTTGTWFTTSCATAWCGVVRNCAQWKMRAEHPFLGCRMPRTGLGIAEMIVTSTKSCHLLKSARRTLMSSTRCAVAPPHCKGATALAVNTRRRHRSTTRSWQRSSAPSHCGRACDSLLSSSTPSVSVCPPICLTRRYSTNPGLTEGPRRGRVWCGLRVAAVPGRVSRRRRNHRRLPNTRPSPWP